MKAFPTYAAAFSYAIEEANLCRRDCGISRTREFGREVFVVCLLPNKENRCGHELTCEVVSPGTPETVTP